MRTPARAVQVAVGVGSVGVLMAAVTGVTALSDRIPDAGYLLRDTTVIADLPYWSGAVGRLITLCWAVAATVTVLAGLVSPRPRRRLLLALGVLIGVLGLDDALLAHEAVLPGRGIPEGLVLVLYACAGLALGWAWLPEARSAVGAAFFTGAALLGVSVVIDAVRLYAFVPEEGAKLPGVLAWGFCGAWAFSEAIGGLRREPARRAST